MNITVYHGSGAEIKIPSLDYGRKDADSYELTESRKKELDFINRQARQETNRVVDLMRSRVQKRNEEPAKLPVIHRRRGR